MLNKLLGRYYKYWYILQYSATKSGNGLSGFIFGNFADLANSISITYVWILGGSGISVVTYLLAGRIFKYLTDSYYNEQLCLWSHYEDFINTSVFLFN